MYVTFSGNSDLMRVHYKADCRLPCMKMGHETSKGRRINLATCHCLRYDVDVQIALFSTAQEARTEEEKLLKARALY